MSNTTTQKSTLPASSLLNKTDQQYDYVDSYSSVIELHRQSLRIEDVGKAFFSAPPSWVDNLFVIRDRIVRLFGLKTSGVINDRQPLLDNFKCEVGEQMGSFKVFSKNEREVILGKDDKHLDFRVSLFICAPSQVHGEELIVSTVVIFNSWLGQLYFLPVKQFHRLIVPTILKGMVKRLQMDKGS